MGNFLRRGIAVAGDQAMAHGTRERGVQSGMEVPDALRGQPFAAPRAPGHRVALGIELVVCFGRAVFQLGVEAFQRTPVEIADQAGAEARQEVDADRGFVLPESGLTPAPPRRPPSK
jgi:hypothetical protein